MPQASPRKGKPAVGRGATKASVQAFARQGIPVNRLASFTNASRTRQWVRWRTDTGAGRD
jgi:hypothetical protein